jgi:hypothetical protein
MNMKMLCVFNAPSVKLRGCSARIGGAAEYFGRHHPTNLKAIIKRPLAPGCIIDLNEQTMRYFNPTLKRGVVPRVKVTPLRGGDWPTGPISAES